MKTALLSLVVVFCLADPAASQRADPDLPDSTLTPGATLEVTREDLCRSDYTSPAANIPIALKQQTFDRYGIRPDAIGYNVDHLIPVSLGGSNSPKNLWPQLLSSEWNYHMKNRLELMLYKMVCKGSLALEKAQQEIAADWVAAYKKYMTKRH
jgi:hypothetical protein